jgi:half-pint family poly-U binding splicing factor
MVVKEEPGVKVESGYIDVELFRDLKETGNLVYGAGSKDQTLHRPMVKPTSTEASQIQKAKKYAMEVSIKMVLMKQTLSHQQAQTKALQRQQALSIMSRIYVGCINYDTKEESVKQAFNAFGPIRSITMSWDPITQKHKGFAFVEFDTPEAAQLAEEQMNGVLVCGRNIKVGRPSQMPQAQQCINEIQAEAKNYFRIYVSSIHTDLSDEDIKSVFSAFGTIKVCALSTTGVPGKHKGYGYIEFDTEQGMTDAISSMNLFDLGGQYLRVGRAVTPPEVKHTGVSNHPPSALPAATAMAAATVTAKMTALESVSKNLGVDSSKLVDIKKRSRSRSRSAERKRRESLIKTEKPAPPVVVKQENKPAIQIPPLIKKETAIEPGTDPLKSAADRGRQVELEKKLQEGQEPVSISQQETCSIKGQEARQLVMAKLMKNRNSESVVLLLRNMVGPDDVDEDLQTDIENECAKYGKVEQVVIYKEEQADSEVLVKIFVEFEKFEQVKAAKESLNGRFFSGRKVLANVYDQDLYNQQDLSG